MTDHPPQILVTGATDGIGRQTALELARRGAHVILHGRNPDKLAATQAALAEAVPGASLDAVCADLAHLDAVRELAATVGSRYPRLDVLLNNAGIFVKERQQSADGLELTMAVNHYAPFLLTHLLLDNLRHSHHGRVVNVASIAHTRGCIDLADLDLEREWTGYAAYATSKLANILFTVELARRLQDAPVTVNALHPGVVGTKLLHEGFSIDPQDSVEEGSATSVHLALAPEVGGISGAYFARSQVAPLAPSARDPALARLFYEMTAARLGLSGLPEPMPAAS